MKREREEFWGLGSRKWFAGAVLMLASASLVFQVGCSQESPMQSTLGTPDSEMNQPPLDPGAMGLGKNGSGGQGTGTSWVIKTLGPAESGTLVVGNVTLTVPVGARDEATQYSLVVPDGPYFRVVLGPHGAQFNVPVTLSIDLSSTAWVAFDNITLYWWDEVTRKWVDVGGVYDPTTHVLTTQLSHFSTYVPGRAGW